MNTIVKIWDKRSNIGKMTAEDYLKKNPKDESDTIFLYYRNGQASQMQRLSELDDTYSGKSPEETCSLLQYESNYNEAKDNLLKKIEIRDKESDVFYVQFGSTNGAPLFSLWLPAQLRTQLLTNTFPAQLKAGNEITVLWTETIPSVKLPVKTQWGIDNLPLVEEYAIKTLNARRENEYLVNTANTTNELEMIDIEAVYKGIESVVLILPIEDLPEDVQQYYMQLAARLAVQVDE